MKRLAALIVFFLHLPAMAAADVAGDPAALMTRITAGKDPRIASTLQRIDGIDRRLLALRAYLRAGSGLAGRWSWSDEQIASFMRSPENSVLQTQIESVRQAFKVANPQFDLWVNPQVRSLDTQLAHWNENVSVGLSARDLLTRFRRWQSSVAGTMPAGELPAAAERFLIGLTPNPIPTLAAPGLSPHGQMRAVDFQVRKDGRTVAGPTSATAATVWDAAGWTQKLAAAVRAGMARFTGPLESPREPWHYTYSP